jgi:hypothetical protein
VKAGSLAAVSPAISGRLQHAVGRARSSSASDRRRRWHRVHRQGDPVSREERLEAVGSSIGESKSLQECLQQHIVTVQAAAFVDRHCCCPACGRQLCHKGKYPIIFRTVFGNVILSSPRFYRCSCHPADSQTFSPLAELLTEHTAPELLYLESRWASLISFGMAAALLKDVLPVAGTLAQPTAATKDGVDPVRVGLTSRRRSLQFLKR